MPAFPQPSTNDASTRHLSAVAIEKVYMKGQHRIPVLRGVEMHAHRGEFLSIVGQSGSGKSTLLHLMGTLRVDNLPPATRDVIRNRVFGFIFQFYHLLPELNVLENVLAPLMIRDSAMKYWKNRREYRDQANAIIEQVELSHRLKHRPSELSGGEMQRAAIARALVARPEILLADEPTGNLDAQTGRGIMDLLCSLNEDHGLTIVMVTHDDAIAEQSHRIVRLANGNVERLEKAAA